MHSDTTYKEALRQIIAGVKYENVSAALGVSVRTLQFWRKQGGIKPLKTGPRGRKIKLAKGLGL